MRCPHPRKLAWDTEQACLDAIAYNDTKYDHKPYLCRCGKWHTTRHNWSPAKRRQMRHPKQ